MTRPTTRPRIVGLCLAAALGFAAAPISAQPAGGDHAVRIDHHSGPVDARYRGTLRVDHRQIGAVAPAGRPSTLRCHWNARMDVTRHASASGGHRLQRDIAGRTVASGSRNGWCSGQHEAIARDVAAQTIDLDRHLRDVAREDHDLLRAELDRLHGAVRTG